MKQEGVERNASEHALIEWTRRHVTFYACQLTDETHNDKQYRLTGTTSHVLRSLPESTRHAVRLARVLADRFAQSVPTVVATDTVLGAIISQDADAAIDLRRDQDRLVESVRRYGDLQAKISATTFDTDLSLDRIELAALVPSLLECTRTGRPNRDRVDNHANDRRSDTAASLTDDDQQYRVASLSVRAKRIAKTIARAASIPSTINHCALCPKNLRRFGDAILIDNWDNARIGPAGLSLHSYFNGATVPIRFLETGEISRDEENVRLKRRLLNAYLAGLIESGYAPEEQLKTALTGSIIASVVTQLLSFLTPDLSRVNHRDTIRDVANMLFDDLISVGDYLARGRSKEILANATVYIEYKRYDAAETLLRRHLRHRRDDARAWTMLIRLLSRRGEWRLAEKAQARQGECLLAKVLEE